MTYPAKIGMKTGEEPDQAAPLQRSGALVYVLLIPSRRSVLLLVATVFCGLATLWYGACLCSSSGRNGRDGELALLTTTTRQHVRLLQLHEILRGVCAMPTSRGRLSSPWGPHPALGKSR
jgi:hypothetical protein